jgi:hypothetical protein
MTPIRLETSVGKSLPAEEPGIEILRPAPGQLTIRGDCSGLLFDLLRDSPRRECIVLQLAIPGSAAPVQLSGKLDSVVKSELRLLDVPETEDARLCGMHSRATIERVQREGLPAHPHNAATYNPLITVWDRAVNNLPSDPVRCLEALAGRCLRVSFVLSGKTHSVEGVLSSLRTKTGGLQFQKGDRMMTLPNPENPDPEFSLRAIDVIHFPETWKSSTSADLEEVVHIRSAFSEGVSVEVATKSGSLIRGIYAGIDDRYLPILTVRVDEKGQTTYRSLPLREVEGIRTFPRDVQTSPIVICEAWKAS